SAPLAPGQAGFGAGSPMPTGRAGLPGAQFQMEQKEARRKAVQLYNSLPMGQSRAGRDDAADKDKGKDATKLFNEIAALEQTRELLALKIEELKKARKKGGISTTSENEGPSVTYHLKTRFTVPSRTEEQILEVARLELQPEYYYKAVPVLT